MTTCPRIGVSACGVPLSSAGWIDTVTLRTGALPGLVDLPADRILFGAVGPLTAAVAKRIGIHWDVIPDRPRVGDLVAALLARMGV